MFGLSPNTKNERLSNMWQFIVKWSLFAVGTLYIVIEKYREYPNEEKDNILGVPIDDDLQDMNRFDLCDFMNEHLPKSGFWELNSTTKIRLGVQLLKNAVKKSGKDILLSNKK
jgi:hypothetical protein